MKILFVIENLGSGGAQRQMVNLAISFKKKGHNFNDRASKYVVFKDNL